MRAISDDGSRCLANPGVETDARISAAGSGFVDAMHLGRIAPFITEGHRPSVSHIAVYSLLEPDTLVFERHRC